MKNDLMNEDNNISENKEEAAKRRRKKSLIWFMLGALFLILLILVLAMNLSSGLFSRSSLAFVFLGLIAFCLGMAFQRTVIKVGFFCVLSVFAAFSVAEVYLGYQRAAYSQVEENDYTTGEGLVIGIDDARSIFAEHGLQTASDAITAPHMNRVVPKLGYRLVNDASEVLGVKLNGDDLVYMAAYHLNPEGWRVTPEASNASEAIIFMGDSYTFGSGLNDEDTFAFKAAMSLGDKYQVYNWGVPGWGTHQVLAMIEDGMLDDVFAKYEKVTVFYMPIDDHQNRIVGKSSWDHDGPCYQLQEDNTVKYVGSFKEVQDSQENQSILLEQFEDDSYKQELMVAMVRQMNRLLNEKYGSEITILKAFDQCGFLYVLEQDGIDLVYGDMSSVDDYLIPNDGHPNSLGTDYFTEQIVEYMESR